MKQPITLLPLGKRALAAAGRPCQCTGQCGHRHKTVDQRCEHEHGGYASKHAGPIRLTAAPQTPRRWCCQCSAKPRYQQSS